MQWINQYSALLLFIIPISALALWLSARRRHRVGRWPLLSIAVAATAAAYYLLSQFQTGPGASAGQVESVLHNRSAGRPVLVELYSDY